MTAAYRLNEQRTASSPPSASAAAAAAERRDIGADTSRAVCLSVVVAQCYRTDWLMLLQVLHVVINTTPMFIPLSVSRGVAYSNRPATAAAAAA